MNTNRKRHNIVLTSTEPINDEGNKYNYIYLVVGIIFFITGFTTSGGVSGGVLILILGIGVGKIIKMLLCKSAILDIRDSTFVCKGKPSYDQLIQTIQGQLIPLDMTIEKDAEGRPAISYKGIIYDVGYNDDDTFSIWWIAPGSIAKLTDRQYITLYKKTCEAYGIIGFNVQQACASANTTDQNFYQK